MSAAMPTRLLILDCDGVLIRSEAANLAYYNHIFGVFGLPGVRVDDETGLRKLHTLSTRQVIEVFFPPDLRAAAHRFAGEADFSPFVALLEEEPGWADVLPRVRRTHPVAVATNRGTSARSVLAAVGLLGCVDLLVTLHDVERPKPEPDVICRVLDHFGVPAEEALYVGDSTLDRDAARAAGVPFLGFRTGDEPSATSPEDVERYLRRFATFSGSVSMASESARS